MTPGSAGRPQPWYDVVVPTVGRSCLVHLLEALDHDEGPSPARVVVVDDRPEPHGDLRQHPGVPRVDGVEPIVLRGAAAGPASARNLGWRACTAPWVVFLDDDVVPRPGWRRGLAADLEAADARDEAAVQGRVHVPLPRHRPPTDRERDVAGLQDAAWITADMAVRRAALEQVGGFDERFRRAYREDTDLALRMMDAGLRLTVGRREVDHPVRPADWWTSVRAQRGNADDALMDRLHGTDWRARGQAPRGRLGRHLWTTATAATAAAAWLSGRIRPAAGMSALWAWQWARYWDHRRTPGGAPAEAAGLAVTSAVIPPAAAWWALSGRVRAARLAPRGRADRWGPRSPGTDPPELVLFDRDGTLVEDVPYNGDPAAVVPVSGAREALDRLRSRGIHVGLITNQSGVARGLIDLQQVRAVNDRVAALLGPFSTVQVCQHGPSDGCSRRKPAPGMVLDAARELGVPPQRCAVVGDIGSDVEAALAAGARAVLVPTSVTRPEEVAGSPQVATDLTEAVDLLLSGGRAVEIGVPS